MMSKDIKTTNKKSTKRTLLTSFSSLLICMVMFIGTTFAWFTDNVTSGKNIIKSGTLDLEMYWTDDLNGGEWYNVEDDEHNTIFDYDNWEPGYTDVKYIKLVNKGNLALNYNLALTPIGSVGKLAEVINVFYADNEVEVKDRSDLSSLIAIGLLNNVMDGGATADGTLLTADQQSPWHKSSETIITLAMNMITTAGNEYQNETIGDGFTITALATQCPYEEDSFGSDYDANAEYPEVIKPGKVSASVAPVDGKVPTGGVTLAGSGISATVPEGVLLEDGVDTLTLTVTPLEHTTSDITVVNNEILIPVDVHIEGVSENNTTPIIIDLGAVMPKYLNMGNYKLFHVEDGTNNEMILVDAKNELNAHNQFTYNPVTGEVSVAMASFSEIAVVADTSAAWQGGEDYDWYNNTTGSTFEIANADQLHAFSKIVGGIAKDEDGNAIAQESFSGKTVTLLSDINLNHGTVLDNAEGTTKTIFYPIGYYNNKDFSSAENLNRPTNAETGVESTVYSFEGTFDGNGHTIANFYQNTWEMFGDYNSGYTSTPNYYKDAMGLFGYVNGGTVKNLTVHNFESDGEFTPTGVIAAYADGDSIFENIAITNCNPRVYNTGNGGIIGIAGSTGSENDDHITLKNITVDNSNIISALWGSWDVACGGLVGMYRGNVDASGNATKDTISFTNCHVAAQIDVYNDVCANYQYYAYRYAGMIIGSVRHNTTNEDGKTIPDMKGISASGCTVNYGTWNDYYYCEFEKNTMASYSEDYQFSRISHSELEFTDLDGNQKINSDDERDSVTGCLHNHTDAEDKQAVYLPFHQLFTGYSWGVNSIGLEKYSGIVTDLDINEGEQNESATKFESKFTGDFLYRVGNSNEVSLSSLFGVKDGATINGSGVYVTIDKVDENSNVSGTFTANATDWIKGTIQFSGTGVVKVTIQDYDFCQPTVLHLEVIDAVNATGATSATKNDVVLLNDCGFSSMEVSGGYTLHGNGFKMTCGSDSTASDMGYAFVTLNNGTLDNVQIVCPNFDYAALYKSNLTSSDNRSETDTSGKTRYYNAKSGVMASGNSQILNSKISGARAAVNVSGGNCVIDNSRIEGGAVASVLVGAANNVILRDVTLVQKPIASTYDNSKKVMGFSVLVMCSVGGDAAPITLEGTLVQNAWVDEDDKQYVPSEGQPIIDEVMKKTEYLHDINDDGTNESLNLGIVYMPADGEYTVNATTVTDNRTNKDAVPYGKAEVKYSLLTTCVYSYKNTNGTDNSTKEVGEYAPSTQSDIITVNYSDTSNGLTMCKSYGTEGWIYELNVDLDKLNSYALDFSKLTISVNGVNVNDFKVDGNAKPVSPVAVVAGGTTYKLTATVNDKEYIVHYKVTGTETSKESPSLVASNYGAGLCVASSYGGTWHGAVPVLEGVQIKYWSVAEQQYKTITLSDYTPTTTGQQNGTNNYWTYTPDNGDFTLTIKNETAVHSSNSVYAMPVVCDSKLYFVASSSNGLVNTGNSARTIAITYYFNDNNNGDELKFSNTWSVEENKDAEYKYSDFCAGTLTQLENCITPDTLITLADGSLVRVDSLTGKEQLLVWNMETGSLDAAPIMFVDSEAEARYEVIKLYFSDGTEVKVISEHGFWDYDLNKYVYLDRDAALYIGHIFAKQNGEKLEKVTLVDVVLEDMVTTAWSPVTAGHLCYFVNGMLSMPGGVGGLFNIFDVDAETMTYDYEAMAQDIETYGLFTYEELSQYAELSREMFDAAGGQYLKVSIGKGNLTEKELIAMIERYGKYFEQ